MGRFYKEKPNKRLIFTKENCNLLQKSNSDYKNS